MQARRSRLQFALSMITAAALAISHQLAPRLAAALVGYGILLSLVTLPMWAWVVGRLVL